MGPEPDVTATIDLRALVDAHFDFVWRSLRRLGVEDASLDDAAQQVWIVVSRREEPVVRSSARAFLFAIAVRVASDARKTARRRLHVADEDAVAAATDNAPLADERMDQQRARQVLDDILDAMPDDLRIVFVLFELEQMTSLEIADAIAVPVGTVSSRLRRARELFKNQVRIKTRGAR